MDTRTVAASAVVLVGVWEVVKAYQNTAPTVTELRETHSDDTAIRQQLLDADMTIGGITVLAAATIWFASGSWAPGIVIVASFVWLSLYYHLIQKGMTSDQLSR